MPSIRQRLSARKAIRRQNKKAKLEERKAKLMTRIPRTRARVAGALKGVEYATKKTSSARSAHYKNVEVLKEPAPLPKRAIRRVKGAVSLVKYRRALEKETSAAARVGREKRRAYRLGRKLVKVDKKLKKQ